MFLRSIFMIVCLLAFLTTNGAYGETPLPLQAGASIDQGNPRVIAEILSDSTKIESGKAFRIGILFRLDPHWHIYWKNSGQAGLPTAVKFNVQKTSLGDLNWPAPTAFSESKGFITTYGYSDKVLLYAEGRTDALPGEWISVEAVADFLACDKICIPGRVKLGLDLAVAGSAEFDSENSEIFNTYASRIPLSPKKLEIGVETVLSKTPVRPGDDFEIAILLKPRGRSNLSAGRLSSRQLFIPERLETLDFSTIGPGKHPLHPDILAIRISGEASPDLQSENQTLRGVVSVLKDGKPVAISVSFPIPRIESDVYSSLAYASLISELKPIDTPVTAVPETAKVLPSSSQTSLLFSFLWMLLLAFLGGLILNLMPCVLPVLAIKAFGIAKLGGADRRASFGHGMAYTGGILTAMAILASLVIGFRAAGTAVGWGFQFQEPIFVALLAGVIVLFAMNLFGIFEVTVTGGGLAAQADRRQGRTRSFLEGILAVVLATPCSAPFMATAVGFALAESASTIYAIFIVLGLGLAAPFLLLTALPSAVRLLPKPGPWMDTLKQLLGFSLLATAIWLAWVIGQQSGANGIIRLLSFLTALAMAAWFFGRAQRSGMIRRGIAISIVIAMLITAGIITLRFTPQATGFSNDGPIAWKPWSREAVAQTLADGKPVFIDFTADWCITCKANEIAVLETERVVKSLQASGAVAYKADWTRRDENIRRELARFGKSGVPMYLVYRPSKPEKPRALPEILTPSLVVEALKEAAASRPRS